MYNIYFEVSAIGFVVLLLIYLHTEYPNSSNSNIRFRRFVLTLLAAEIFDVLTAKTIDYGAYVQPAVNLVLNTVYFAISAVMGLSYTIYIDSFLHSERRGLFFRINAIIFVVYVLALVGNLRFGYIFYFNAKGEYIHGPAYLLTFGTWILYCIVEFINLRYHRNQLEKRQTIASWGFLVLFVVGSVLQVFLFPKILITLYMGSLAVYVFLFVIETPDYLKLQQTMQELEAARQEADEQYQKAAAANRSKSQFLAQMSHEIRTPINAVIGMNEMILREEQDLQILEYAMDIRRSADSLLSIINDILDLSKIESGKMELVLAEYEVSSLLHDVVNMISMKAQDKNLVVQLSLDESLPSRLYGDDVRIRQILVNLLNNAVKYTEQGSVSLKVKGQTQGGDLMLHVEVEDTGIGIRSEDIEKLFLDYQRIEEERNRLIEGTGLGMSITRQLLYLMGSDLQVFSEYGKGSRFSFDLRQKIVDLEPIGNLESRIKEQAAEFVYDASFIAPDALVLLVDDNAVNRKVFRNLLKETKVQIEEAAGGYECLEMVKKKRYDVIFLDHMMPDLDGVDTLKTMQSYADYPSKGVPVIALTANAISGAREMYLELGFSDFLSKPIRTERLEPMLFEYLPKEKRKKAQPGHVRRQENQIASDAFPDIDGVDWEYAMQHMHDYNLLRDTVMDFMDMAESERMKLQDCMDVLQKTKTDAHPKEYEEALRQYRVRVHSMKSNAAMIGAMTVSSLAKILEYAARDGKLDVIESLHAVLFVQWEELYRCLSESFKAEETGNALPEIEADELLDSLGRLTQSMEDYDVDTADALMQHLLQFRYAKDAQQDIIELNICVKNLDAEGVNACAERLRGRIHGEK